MTLPPDVEDTSKALHSDGAWHLMPKDTWADKFVTYDYPHKSIIYHQCRNHWKQKPNSEIWTPSVQYRVEIEELGIACGHCGETCPEALQGLWLLHNFDSIQSHPQ